MKKSNSHEIAFIGISVAITFILLLVETYFFMFMLNFTPCILTISFAIALSICGDKKFMFIGGTILGCCSFVLSFLVGLVPFMNPLISILPRIFIGIISYFSYKLFCNLFKNVKNETVKNTLPISLAGVIGVFVNTLLVTSMLFIFRYSGISEILGAILCFNFLFEVISGIVLTPIYYNVIRRFKK